ncbi:glycosyltransferase involved in cell wall biosynthesis [Paenibacillus endophyticus]|uniref:4,4'-diaponeurosporenoate glycosyltransferase n=1 Tax=Paenibacillus endophyticus TaxID=1294268 RepID=A0A7W5G980_9BACL|nr:glycosyltransferase family 2 protein [Paenibacillus endophyticus]MBB3151435.1 glycosyltransferase involved in cell wall biosynthesis [Paenibacillus endophyticus]
MWITMLLLLGCLSAFIVFRKNTIPVVDETDHRSRKLSVIIPARNEQFNLPYLLDSLQSQTYQPFEIIVVDDFSTDRTREIAESYGVKVISGKSLPQGWTGKSWAVWNGYLHAKGDAFAFLDADIRLAPQALALLMKARERSKGVISVVPFHQTEKLYEKLALVMNILGIFAFTSVFEKSNPQKGVYGSCILALREDYEAINGHESVKSEVLDDLLIGSKFMEAGIPVTNFIGYGLVSFRMYPTGIRSQIEGFSKGAILSTGTLSLWTVVPIAIWTIGLLLTNAVWLFINTSWALPLMIGYLIYMLQLFYFAKHVGVFGILIPVFHFVSSLFFLIVMGYSLYQVVVLGKVKWKGRYVKVRGRRGS